MSRYLAELTQDEYKEAYERGKNEVIRGGEQLVATLEILRNGAQKRTFLRADGVPDAYWNGYADAFDAALSYAQAFLDTFKH